MILHTETAVNRQHYKSYTNFTFVYFLFRGIFCIHPSFRIIGLAEPPVIGSSQPQWLNSELLSMFLFHHVSPLSKQEEAQVIYEMVSEETILPLL